jgi:hypothetical protein
MSASMDGYVGVVGCRYGWQLVALSAAAPLPLIDDASPDSAVTPQDR